MKKQVLILIISLFTGSQTYPQQNILDGVYLEPGEEQVARIEKIVKDANAQISSFNKVEKSKDSLGYRHAYYDGKELKLVTAFYKENPDLYKSVSWYFHKGRLVYAESRWTDAERNASFNDEKLYLEHEQLVWWTIGGKPVNKSSATFRKGAGAMGDYALKLKLENKN